jgi:glycosyltransferase involved in cell wall biosynthesis
MKIAIAAPSPAPYTIGGAEKLCWGLLEHLNESSGHQAELIKLPCREGSFWELLDAYERFAALDLSHFDLVISTKYPSWMIRHERHVCYMLHPLRGLYDTYALSGQPLAYRGRHAGIAAWRRFMGQNAGSREALPEFFARAAALRAEGLPEDALGLPGPLLREVVRFLDGIGLARGAIARYAAISATVTHRADYFPPGAKPIVLHPPSNLRNLGARGSEHLFTIARLDHVKRVALLVEAMRRSKADLPFRIAGTGPEESALRELAAGDPRIEFLGFVRDREAEELYADAFAVLYAPRDEDYGLVALEAMACGKPVITTTDAGGPTELVVDGQSGFCVAPDPAAIAERIDYLWEHGSERIAMGLRGRERVRDIRWENVAAGLLGDASAPARLRPRRRLRLAVATTFPVHPPEGGGQVRVYELYRNLAREMDVDLVTLGRRGEPAFEGEIAPGLRERRVPPSDAHAAAEERISRDLDWVPVTDVAFPELHELTPDYVQRLRESASAADLVFASHPYVLPALEAAAPGARLWYEAQDVEADLKRRTLPAAAANLLEQTRRVEAVTCSRAQGVLVCSADDGKRLVELYELSAERVHVVPNGVDVDAVAYVAPAERARRKAALGIEDVFAALFMGSWHPPNIEAVRYIFELAELQPDVRFLVVGSAGAALARERVPPNVGLMGVVDSETKALVLGAADVALNPMASGSGTNLKMLEYCAAGLPVISTPHGARGLTLRDGEHLQVAELSGFAVAIEAARCGPGAAEARARVERARAWVERRYAWRQIAAELSDALRTALDAPSVKGAR